MMKSASAMVLLPKKLSFCSAKYENNTATIGKTRPNQAANTMISATITYEILAGLVICAATIAALSNFQSSDGGRTSSTQLVAMRRSNQAGARHTRRRGASKSVGQDRG